MALEKQTKTPETESAQQGAAETPSASRRKLVKGAFAAPMILTLHSGAVVARSSNTPTLAAASQEEFPAYQCMFPAHVTDPGDLPSCTNFTTNPGSPEKCDAGEVDDGLSFIDVGNPPMTTEQCNEMKFQGQAGLIVTGSCVGSVNPSAPV